MQDSPAAGPRVESIITRLHIRWKRARQSAHLMTRAWDRLAIETRKVTGRLFSAAIVKHTTAQQRKKMCKCVDRER